MQAPSGQMTGPALRALLEDGALAGEWVLDPRQVQHPAEEQGHGAWSG